MAKGLVNREIGDVLGISPATVKRHVSAVIEALDVTNRTEATTALHELGLGQATRNEAQPAVAGFGTRPAIAVLPFGDFSADPEQRFLAEGVVEDLTTRLARWRWFPVIARNTAGSPAWRIFFPPEERPFHSKGNDWGELGPRCPHGPPPRLESPRQALYPRSATSPER